MLLYCGSSLPVILVTLQAHSQARKSEFERYVEGERKRERERERKKERKKE